MSKASRCSSAGTASLDLAARFIWFWIETNPTRWSSAAVDAVTDSHILKAEQNKERTAEWAE